MTSTYYSNVLLGAPLQTPSQALYNGIFSDIDFDDLGPITWNLNEVSQLVQPVQTPLPPTPLRIPEAPQLQSGTFVACEDLGMSVPIGPPPLAPVSTHEDPTPSQTSPVTDAPQPSDLPCKKAAKAKAARHLPETSLSVEDLRLPLREFKAKIRTLCPADRDRARTARRNLQNRQATGDMRDRQRRKMETLTANLEQFHTRVRELAVECFGGHPALDSFLARIVNVD